MNRKWITTGLFGAVVACSYANQDWPTLPDLPQRRISLSILRAMPATNLLEFVTHRTGLRLDLADEIKTNAVSFRFKFDEASCTDILGWVLHFLNAHATLDGAVLRVAAGSPPELPEGKPLTSSSVLAQPFTRTNSWSHRVDQTVEYVLHVAGQKNFIMGPDSPIFQSTVLLDPKGRTSAEILEDICAQAGLECSLRGSSLVIQKKEEKGLPNEASQDTSLRADPER